MFLIILVLVVTFLVCYSISHLFLAFWLWEDLKKLRKIKSDIFSIIFGLSNVYLITLMIEILQIDDFEIRFYIWKIIVLIFTIIMFYTLPYYILKQAVFKKEKRVSLMRSILLFLLYILYLFIANKLLNYFKERDNILLTFYLLPSQLLEFLGLMSIFLSAVLGGYGTTHCILNYLIYPYLGKSIDEKLQNVQEKKKSIEITLVRRRTELNQAQREENEETKEQLNKENSVNDNNTDSSNASNTTNNLNLGENSQFLKAIKEEIEELKMKYHQLEMSVSMLKERTIAKYRKFIDSFQLFTGKLLAIYCVYRIVMTLRNYFFSNYQDINVMLREEALSILDRILSFVYRRFAVKVDKIYFILIQQYFSLISVGSIIIINIRSFLNTILFLYSKFFKNIGQMKNLQLLLLSYFVGLFYVTTSIFVIFNLPVSYRTEVVRVYGDLDYSLLKYYYDKTYIIATIISAIVETFYIKFS